MLPSPALRLILGISLALPTAGAHAGPIDLSGEVGLVSDYRTRGLSLSEHKPALQGGLIAAHANGAYAGIWASSIEYSEGNDDAEVDAYAGYAFSLGGGASLDLMAHYYGYPAAIEGNYFEFGAALVLEAGRLTPRVSAEYAPAQNATRDAADSKADNLYLVAGVEYALGDSPLKLGVQLGYERGVFDMAGRGGKWDWQAGASYESERIRLGVSYIGSNLSAVDDPDRLGGETLVASLALLF